MKNPEKFLKKYGPWALVTGGASGIGAEFARRLAETGFNMVLADMQGEKLASVAREVTDNYGVSVETAVTDLSKEDFMSDILPVVQEKEIGLLVNNAGYGAVGEFLMIDPEEMLKTVYTNCRAPILLTCEYGNQMKKRGRGGIIFIASSSAFLGTPYVSNYAATKGFNLLLGEGLWDELREYNIDVLAFAPGPTNTPAFNSVTPKNEAASRMPIMETGPTVREALNALGRKPSAVAGRMNRLITFISTRILSRSRAVRLVGSNTRLLYPKEGVKIDLLTS